MTQAAITCRPSHFLAPVLETLCGRMTLIVEEILAEREALTEKSKKFSVQYADVFSFCSESCRRASTPTVGAIREWLLPYPTYASGRGSTLPVITCFWSHLWGRMVYHWFTDIGILNQVTTIPAKLNAAAIQKKLNPLLPTNEGSTLWVPGEGF